MAQKRYISTNFWKDNYVIELDPSEKLLFLYLLTNKQTNIAGVYEISLREMAFDTGYDKEMLQKMLDRFEKDEKIHYEKGWLYMHNWVKHQSLNTNMEKGVKTIIEASPNWLQNYIKSKQETV